MKEKQTERERDVTEESWKVNEKNRVNHTAKCMILCHAPLHCTVAHTHVYHQRGTP